MSQESGALVVFTPSGKRGRFPLGTPLIQAARELGVDIDSICGGRARCGRCQVLVSGGHFAKEQMDSSADHLSALNATEQECLDTGLLRPGHRLSCQALVEGDVRIDVPASSQVHRQVVRKEHEARDITIDPVLHLYYVEVPEPDIAVPDGNAERLLKALEAGWGLNGLECELPALQSLQAALRDGKWKITVAVRNGHSIVATWPGFRDKVYGAAVDVGSTTLAADLCDLGTGEVLASTGAMNPQIRFGEDLMSRVSYAMLNPGGAERLTRAVREELNRLLQQAAVAAGIRTDAILEVTLVGNPVMHHLALGLDPGPLGVAPFALATDRSVETPASGLGLEINAGARAWFLPCIAGHVGADTAGMLLAEKPWERDEISLLIDVGTNAELVLGNSERLMAASSPTGPAFEGAQVSSGQRAAPGAIERVRIDPDTLEPRFRVIGSELWSDESGFETRLGGNGVTGICGSGIIEAVAGLYLAGVVRPDGVIDGSLAERSSRIEAAGRTFSYRLHDGPVPVCIRQGDIRAIQLAKAALHAGARLLMERMGVKSIDRIRLAGAFGSYIDVKYAMVLGMIPDCDLGQVSSAANAAGTGARIALLNGEARNEIECRTREIEKVETAVDPQFQQYFVEAMGIPHSTLEYRHLSQAMSLPACDKPGPAGLQRRSRRGRRNLLK
jgi:uncharacterized 2Fe-2S/4Fe-4S cluster protein (DUF4445 family)